MKKTTRKSKRSNLIEGAHGKSLRPAGSKVKRRKKRGMRLGMTQRNGVVAEYFATKNMKTEL